MVFDDPPKVHSENDLPKVDLENPQSWGDAIKVWTEVAFNLAKIAGLIVAAGWTYYQWDKVIFPKESAEQFKRRVEQRADLEFYSGAVDFQILQRSDIKDGPLPRKNSERARQDISISASGTILVRNRKNFPIEVAIKGVSLNFGRLDVSNPSQEYGTIRALTSKWVESEKFNLLASEDKRLVLESQGVASFPLNGVYFYSSWDFSVVPVRIELSASLAAVNPNTGIAVADVAQTKEKVFRLDLLIDPNKSENIIIGSPNVSPEKSDGEGERDESGFVPNRVSGGGRSLGMRD